MWRHGLASHGVHIAMVHESWQAPESSLEYEAPSLANPAVGLTAYSQDLPLNAVH